MLEQHADQLWQLPSQFVKEEAMVKHNADRLFACGFACVCVCALGRAVHAARSHEILVLLGSGTFLGLICTERQDACVKSDQKGCPTSCQVAEIMWLSVQFLHMTQKSEHRPREERDNSEQSVGSNPNQLRVDICTCSWRCTLQQAKIPSGKTPPEQRRSASQRIQKHIRKVTRL